MKPFKMCKCGTLCASGYCIDCRARDETTKTIKTREKMDKEALNRAKHNIKWS